MTTAAYIPSFIRPSPAPRQLPANVVDLAIYRARAAAFDCAVRDLRLATAAWRRAEDAGDKVAALGCFCEVDRCFNRLRALHDVSHGR